MSNVLIALYKWGAIFFFINGIYYWFKPEAKIISIMALLLALMFSLFWSIATKLKRTVAIYLSRCTGFNP